MEASRLDPNAPILVRNIAVLHEKLGEVDDALTYFRKYGQMNIPADARQKNEVDIRRLEGAKKELEEKERLRQAALLAQQHHDTPPTPPGGTEAPSHGRIDALSIGFAAGAGVALIVGTIFGVKAEASRPSSGFVTGRDGTYNDLVNRANVAHNDAVVADVCFGLGIGAAVTAVLLYALRTKEPPKPAPTTSVSAAPTPGGAAVVFGARF
jgi:hypothetical protein